MSRSEISVLIVFAMLIVVWAVVGSGGWVAGAVFAVAGIVIAATMVGRRRRSPG